MARVLSIQPFIPHGATHLSNSMYFALHLPPLLLLLLLAAVAFERPCHMGLRARIAGSLEQHMARLASLVGWAAAADSAALRGALLRLAVRAGGLGGGMSPFLVPLVRSWCCAWC